MRGGNMSESYSKEKEYYTLFEIINRYDERFITIKGWGVTVSMAFLGAGFQFGHYGLFFVASVSSFAFWMFEATIKRHQMRHYVRMRELELPEDGVQYKPKIDWTWKMAPGYYEGKTKPTRGIAGAERYGSRLSYNYAVLMPSVLLPYIISCPVGAILFLIGSFGKLHLADGKVMPI